jgi:pimeloyl-ACP methyl ester carboxylesterase
MDRRIASFTALSAPRFDAMRKWALARLRPRRRDLGELTDQLRRSWYMAAIQIPRLPEMVLRARMQTAWPLLMRRGEGIEPRPGHPADTLVEDAVRGLAMYRENISAPGRARGPAQIPVQLIIPTRDRYVSPSLYAEADSWAAQISRHELDTGHWVQRSEPEAVAGLITALIERPDPEGQVSGGASPARWKEA